MDISIIRRAKEHELSIMLEEREFKAIYPGRRPAEEPRLEIIGNAAEGFYIRPTAERGHKTRSTKVIDRKRELSADGGRNYVLQSFIGAKGVGLTEEYRARQYVRTTMENGHIFLPPINPAWHGKSLPDVLAKSGEQRSVREKLQAEQEAAKEHALELATRPPTEAAPPVLATPEAVAAPPVIEPWVAEKVKPLSPAPKPIEPRRPTEAERVTAEEETVSQVYTGPHAPKSTLPGMGGGDLAAQHTASLRRLMQICADANREMRLLHNTVRLEIENNRIVVLRVYRPGQVQLRT